MRAMSSERWWPSLHSTTSHGQETSEWSWTAHRPRTRSVQAQVNVQPRHLQRQVSSRSSPDYLQLWKISPCASLSTPLAFCFPSDLPIFRENRVTCWSEWGNLESGPYLWKSCRKPPKTSSTVAPELPVTICACPRAPVSQS
jgi:hypothetical protein